MKTTFVIGAGASCEVGLPTGPVLKERIADLLNIQIDFSGNQTSGDPLLASAITHHAVNTDPNKSTGPLFNLGKTIGRALPYAASIDNYLDTHRDDRQTTLLAKIAIVRAILEAESKSALRLAQENPLDNPRIDAGRLANSWFTLFFQALVENCTADNISNRLRDISLVIFNYDRCIEHFLFHTLLNYYRLDAHDAADLVSKIDIYHPYGTVGDLEWASTQAPCEYGKEPNELELFVRANDIRTFAQGTDPNQSNITALRRSVLEADRVVFLGFAFHRINMDLLRPVDGNPVHMDGRTLIGSAYRMSEDDRRIVSSRLSSIFGSKAKRQIADVTAFQLFQEYRLSLAFEE